MSNSYKSDTTFHKAKLEELLKFPETLDGIRAHKAKVVEYKQDIEAKLQEGKLHELQKQQECHAMGPQGKSVWFEFQTRFKGWQVSESRRLNDANRVLQKINLRVHELSQQDRDFWLVIKSTYTDSASSYPSRVYGPFKDEVAAEAWADKQDRENGWVRHDTLQMGTYKDKETSNG